MNRVIKIDLSSPVQEGFISADPFVKYPWKIKSSSVTLIKAGNVVEKISREDRGFFKFMDECWRILKIDGQMLISTPYAGSTSFWANPANINGCVAQTWHYFDPESPTGLWGAYKPKPWKVDRCFFQADGVMEVLLVKRELK